MERKDIIKNYVDACELIKEIDESINNIKGSMYAHDIVSGSSPEFPYHRIGIHISGSSPDPRKEKELGILIRRRHMAYKLKTKAEEEMSRMPARIQRIIRYKIIDGMKWEEVAEKMGGGCTGNSIRVELNRYFREKNKVCSMIELEGMIYRNCSNNETCNNAINGKAVAWRYLPFVRGGNE